ARPVLLQAINAGGELPRLHASVGVDGDPIDVLARLFGLRQADAQHAIAEVGLGLVYLDAIERNAALERAVVALAVSFAIIVFGLLLAADRQHAVGNFDLNVLFAQAGKLGGNSDGLVGFVKLDARPAELA